MDKRNVKRNFERLFKRMIEIIILKITKSILYPWIKITAIKKTWEGLGGFLISHNKHQSIINGL